MTDIRKQPKKYRQKSVWFLNGTLVKKQHISRAQGTIILHDINKEEKFMVPMSEWKKKRRRAFLVSETARLLNLHRKSLPRLVKRGLLPPPVGAVPGGVSVFGKKAYYSEDTIKDMRQVLAGQHIGRPRKDGYITNNKTPTALELSSAMGDSAQLYTKDKSGNFIPVFAESLYD